MSDADEIVGEVRAFPAERPPPEFDWLPCDGRTLSVFDYQALYTIIGTTYGSARDRTFKIPDLRGCVIMATAFPSSVGKVSGEESVSLTVDQMPAHNHEFQMQQPATFATDAIGAPVAGKDWLAHPWVTTPPPKQIPGYVKAGGTTTSATLHPATLATVGGGLPHKNRQRFLAMPYYICCAGDYPLRG